jgi:hypothetical protein
MASEPDPPWMREAAGAIAHELLGWLRALVAVTRAPRRFCAEWAAGEIRPLNPLAYSLNTLAVVVPAAALVTHLIGIEDDVLPLWAQLLKPLFPWVYDLLWLLPVHFALRALGGTRRLGTTVGASFYASGPLHFVRVFYVPLQLWQMAHPTDLRFALMSAVSGLVVMVLFCSYSTAALAGAHQMPRWRAAVVVVVFFVVSAALWAWLGIRTGHAGMRVVRAMIT